VPYIPARDRALLNAGTTRPVTPGELNYAITKACNDYLVPPLTYAGINTVVGVLECVKQELYRRLAAPYEDEACRKNGDVY
jgi:hypothetical protein